MNNFRLAAVVAVNSMFASLSSAASVELDLPTCEREVAVTTPIHFFVELGVRENRDIVSQIRNDIGMANTVLENSCIPMRRKLASVTYVEIDERFMLNLGWVHFGLEQFTGQDKIASIKNAPNVYYGVVLSDDSGYFAGIQEGQTARSEFEKFFILSESADELTLEHELGHLAWAEHDPATLAEQLDSDLEDTTPAWDQHKIKAYARGALCGNAGTVMSYQDNILPIYSSPNFYYQKYKCGDSNRADNARVLTEYAYDLASQLKQ
ncbi:hypothetical protein [Vibrio profundi]|uniref:hypothetical protein n=1 Tax=Vibrio profundi TaxID=1774960 RepID=UPI00373520F6